MRHEMGPQLVGQALDQHGADMPEEFRAMARLYVDRTEAICDLWEHGVSTLCHGDCHIGEAVRRANAALADRGTVDALEWGMGVGNRIS